MNPKTKIWISRETLMQNKENNTVHPAIVVHNAERPVVPRPKYHEVIFSNGCGCGHSCDQTRRGRVVQALDGVGVEGTISTVWVELEQSNDGMFNIISERVTPQGGMD